MLLLLLLLRLTVMLMIHLIHREVKVEFILLILGVLVS